MKYIFYSLKGGISIHSPRVGRDITKLAILQILTDFNPLSPRGERHNHNAMDVGIGAFQSTLPAWGETIGPMRSAKR